MLVGIDLGTTFCCVAYVGDDGEVRVIPTVEGDRTTPSVIWFDGRQAVVGRKAILRKVSSPQHVYEFVKRDIGRPVELAPGQDENDPDAPQTAPYLIDRFKYGAAGMSAIILRKLKRDALAYCKKIGKVDRGVDEKHFALDAVVTVPASFGELERQETKLAGYAAGINVVAIINEPTAAAFAYGLTRSVVQRILVFDLGGGTLDVTILELQHADLRAVTSKGDNTLGGRDWDALIEQYLHDEFERVNGCPIPDDAERQFEVQELAVAAKFALTDAPSAEVAYSIAEGELATTLYRQPPPGRSEYDMSGTAADVSTFYFEERASDLLARCRTTCERALEQASLAWADVDEIVLAGGASRMPMIPAMLEQASGRRIRRHVEGFDYDTAIATGAALYGLHRERVTDVVSHGLGVRLQEGGREFIDYLIEKNAPLPASARRTYRAPASARLDVYEGESHRPADCTPRGELRLENPAGHATVDFALDTNGMLRVGAIFPVDAAGGAPAGGPAPTRRSLEIRNDLYRFDRRADPLREKVQSLAING